ncbi:MAG: hypothetical protein ABEJ72_03445 [Candidatus Aenigmatarchaeota archaeon]
MPNDLHEIFDSGKEISESEFQREVHNGGRRSKYESYKDLASDLEPGTRFKFELGATENQVSGIRSQVYKLNDDDADKSDREFEVHSRRKKSGGREITDEEGNVLFTVYIKRNGHDA